VPGNGRSPRGPGSPAPGAWSLIPRLNPLPLNPDLTRRVSARAVLCFSWGLRDVNKAALLLIGNICCDFPQAASFLLDDCVFIETYHFVTADVQRIADLMVDAAYAGLCIVQNPFDDAHLLQVTTFVKELIRYRFSGTIEVGLRMAQILALR